MATSKLTGFPEGVKLQINHLFPTPRGNVYLAWARKDDNSVAGPYYLFESLDSTNEALAYRIDFPERMIAVFSKDLVYSKVGSLNEVFSVPIQSQSDMLRLYLSLVTGAPPLSPPLLRGEVVAENNGTQFPWWSWSIQHAKILEPHEQTGKGSDLLQIEKNPKQWIASHPHGNFESDFHPIALLTEQGSLFEGTFLPGTWLRGLPKPERFRAPINDFQRYFYTLFHPFQKSEDERIRFASAFKEDFLNGVSFQVELPGKGILNLNPTLIEVRSSGLPIGSGRNPNYSLALKIYTLEDLNILIAFQHNLPGVAKRTIELQSESKWRGGFGRESAISGAFRSRQ